MPELEVKEEEMDKLLDKFEEVMRFLSQTDEEVKVSDVAKLIVITVGHYFDHLKIDNPAIARLCENSEMSLTTSIIFGIGALTSKGEDVKDFMKGCVETNGKPN